MSEVLNKEGLEHFISKLKNGEVKGEGLTPNKLLNTDRKLLDIIHTYSTAKYRISISNNKVDMSGLISPDPSNLVACANTILKYINSTGDDFNVEAISPSVYVALEAPYWAGINCKITQIGSYNFLLEGTDYDWQSSKVRNVQINFLYEPDEQGNYEAPVMSYNEINLSSGSPVILKNGAYINADNLINSNVLGLTNYVCSYNYEGTNTNFPEDSYPSSGFNIASINYGGFYRQTLTAPNNANTWERYSQPKGAWSEWVKLNDAPKIVSLTEAEYNAISVKDANSLYLIPE